MPPLPFDTYLSPFTWRYGSPAMRALWSEEARRRRWRQVWVALASAQHEAGLVSAAQLADLQAQQNNIDLPRAHQHEAETRHDVMAEIRTYAEQAPLGGAILHLGATSMDILDNADVLGLRAALNLLQTRLHAVLARLAERIEAEAETPCMAYTHLQPAEPTTLGYRFAHYAQDLLGDAENLARLLGNLRGKGFKGAVGTSASYAVLLEGTGWTPARLEARALELLGLPAFPVTSQTYPRKQDWQVGNVLAGIAGSLYKFAFDVRLLQAPPFGEWSEPFGAKQVGSSAMPFKRNPIKAENLDSLARWVAAQVSVLWDNAAHSLLERTLDDSANRRTVLPELCLALDEILIQAEALIGGLVLQREAIARNVAIYAPFSATEPLLMRLVRAGGDRQSLHEILREHSLAAWAALGRGETNPLAENLCADPRLTALLPAESIRRALDAHAHIGDAPARAQTLAGQIRAIIGASNVS